jgi:hypothetical protein
MKTLFQTLILILLSASTVKSQVVSVLNIDTKGISIDPSQMGNIVRIELDKLGLYEVTDKYDVYHLVDKAKMENCYGKTCLVEVGKILGSEKMLTGNIERFGESIIVNFRLINVQTGAVEKNYIKEFLNYPHEIQRIVRLSVREMFGLENEAHVMQSLTQKQAFESIINQPNTKSLKLDGPRMGFAVLTGKNASIMRNKPNEGGYDMFPVMSQIGYQFETQYLNEGNFQALVEFIPMITGLDQGTFIPSITILNGIRNNKSGFEIAFGPTLGLVSVASGYYDGNGQWRLRNPDMPAGTQLESRMDSRGDIALRTGFVIAFGKSFRSGKMNLPVNGYIIPHKDGMRVGLSFGFNARN